MRYFLLSLLIIIQTLFFSFPSTLTHAKSIIEPCSSSNSCPYLLSYLLPYDLKLSEIAYRFRVNISHILAANSINIPPTLSSFDDKIIHAKSLVKIPISCPCVDGIRRSISTMYTVWPADTLDSISNGFGGLVSAEQIRTTNGLNAKNPLMSGQSLVIPLPCTCFDNTNNGVTTVYMSYVVQSGESVSGIAAEFGTTVTDLEAVNGLGQPVVDPGDILAIPIPACSSENLNWYNESLIVPNGSYALTANNCIKCICGPTDLDLQCLWSGISCSHLQCKNSDLFIGDAFVKQAAIGCNITACVYRGHYGNKIFRSIVNSSHVQCPGKQSYNAASPGSGPSSFDPVVPFVTLSPSPFSFGSPFSAPSPVTGLGTSSPPTQQNPNISSHGILLTRALFYSFFLSKLAFSFIFVNF